MTSIEFNKKCKPFNKQYYELFGYIPCRDDYLCTQNEFYNALMMSVFNKKEIGNYLKRKFRDYNDLNKKY